MPGTTFDALFFILPLQLQLIYHISPLFDMHTYTVYL
jgi:hypothetical protein